MRGLEETVARWDTAVIAGSGASGEPGARGVSSALLPGAPEPAIDALEVRLGVRLPASFRRFLQLSDGAIAQPGLGVGDVDGRGVRPYGLWDTRRIAWLRDTDPASVTAWETADDAQDLYDAVVSEAEYLDDTVPTEPFHFKCGHLRWCLQISSSYDGWMILLNPMVRTATGEWEAWDFGAKHPGAIRHRSFEALLSADVDALERRLITPPPARADRYPSIPPELQQRLDVLEEQASTGADVTADGARAALAALAHDRDLSVDGRQAALHILATVPAEPARELAAFLDPGEPRLQVVALGRLAASSVPADRRAATDALADPRTPDWVIRSLPPTARDVVYDAWRIGPRPDLLHQLACFGDRRVVPELGAAIVDRSLPDDERDRLVRYAARSGDPAVVPALLEAAAFEHPATVDIARTLLSLGARAEAIAVLGEAVGSGRDRSGRCVALLGDLTDPRAGEVLVAAIDGVPTAPQLLALGCHPTGAAHGKAREALGHRDLELPLVRSLERMGDVGADTLAQMSADGSLAATRALARRRDRRALDPLLEALRSSDVATARAGADGLRDLRDDAAADVLAAAAGHPDRTGVATIAVHALVTMRAPRAGAACEVLAADPDPVVRRLGRRWLDELQVSS